MVILPLDPRKWFESLPRLIEELYRNEFKNSSAAIPEKILNELLITNFTLWQYEDNARRRDVSDKEIAGIKRNIDKNNQKRHDLADAIDAVFREDIEKKIKSINKSLPLNSETPASVFDRLMVIALRARNLKKETERGDTGESHIERCSLMLKEVENRSEDLLKCLEELLEDYYSGRKKLKSYKQHKLYNDPALNPSLRK